MKIEVRWINCLWLLVPLLVWNTVLAPKITLEQINSDAHSPAWLLMAENITRIVVFAFPLLLPLRIQDGFSKTGLAAAREVQLRFDSKANRAPRLLVSKMRNR